jgi:xylan 1,4-beta-xylosidase
MYIRTQLSIKINSKIVHISSIDSPITNDYQFFLIQKGSIAYSTRDEIFTMQKDDVLIIEPNAQFSLRPLSPNTLVCLHIDEASLSRLLPFGSKIFCNSVSFPSKDYRELRRILIDICSEFYASDNENRIMSLFYQLSDCLCKNFIQTAAPAATNADLTNANRINQIISYIRTNYNQALSLTTLSEELFLTPRYLSTFIKKNLDTTFLKYLTQVRLQNALTELIETDSSVVNIAYNNGFPNIAAFNKSFRKIYQCSPSEYKREALKRKESFLANSDSKLYEADLSTSFDNQIQINTKHIVPYHKTWNDTINLGSLSNLLTSSFYDSIRRYYNTLSVKYVRITDVLSKKIIKKDTESGIYNFTNLDTFLDFLCTLDLIPFIKLEKTCTNPESMDSDGPVFDFDYEILEELMKHCLYRYGYKFISSWRFEIAGCHNNRLSTLDTPSGYTQFYTQLYQTIKQHFPECQIGGPGYNICGDFDQFKSHFKFYTEHKLPFNFISLYAYSYKLSPSGAESSFDVAAIISPDPAHIYHAFCRYEELIIQNCPNIPIFVSELGATIFGNNYIYDSVYLSAFLCKSYLGLFQHCDCIAFNGFTVPPSDLDYQSSTYNSKAGMVSSNGIPNPVLHAYSFLNNLGRNLISYDDNYIMTCNSSNRYQLLVFNYVHFNKQFCMNPLDDIALENTYSIFEEASHQVFLLECHGISPGRYKVTQFALNRNYGSALDKYIQILKQGNTTSAELLSTLLHFTEKETAYYRQTSIPRQDIHYTDFDDTLRMNIALAPHEVQFFEFLRVV